MLGHQIQIRTLTSHINMRVLVEKISYSRVAVIGVFYENTSRLGKQSTKNKESESFKTQTLTQIDKKNGRLQTANVTVMQYISADKEKQTNHQVPVVICGTKMNLKGQFPESTINHQFFLLAAPVFVGSGKRYTHYEPPKNSTSCIPRQKEIFPLFDKFEIVFIC